MTVEETYDEELPDSLQASDANDTPHDVKKKRPKSIRSTGRTRPLDIMREQEKAIRVGRDRIALMFICVVIAYLCHPCHKEYLYQPTLLINVSVYKHTLSMFTYIPTHPVNAFVVVFVLVSVGGFRGESRE